MTRWIEVTILILGLLAVVGIPFLAGGPSFLAFLAFPLVIGLALRFHLAGAISAALGVTALTLGATLSGRGPFAAGAGRDLPELLVALAALAGSAVWTAFAIRRYRTSARVAESEERLKLALEGAEDGIWDWNLETHEITFNDRWLAMLGYEPGEVPPSWKGWIELVHPDDAAGVKKALEAHLAGQIPFYQTEHRMRAHSGEWRWILARAKVVERDTMGRALRVSGTHKDITERKRAREALIRSEAMIRAILETAPDGMITINEQGKIESFNAAAERIFGYSSGELLGRNVRLLMPPPDREQHDDYLNRYLESGQSKILGRTREVLGCRRDSTVFPLELAVGEVRLGDHRLFTGVLRDVTARKEAEENLKLYRAIVENTSEGVQLTRIRDEVIVYANPAIEKMFGFRPGELIGKHVGVLYAGDDKGTRDFLRKVAESLDEDTSWRGEARAIRRGGGLFWCRTRIATFDHPKYGAVWISVHEDITEQMRAEEERYWLEDQLRQAHRMESLGQLAGGVAHDFNNLLVVIGGHLKFALEELPEDHPVFAELRQAEVSTSRAAALAHKLLAFSQRRIDRPVDADLGEVVDGVRDTLRTAVPENVEVEIEIGPDLGTIHVDVAQIEQVLLNLCLNAREAMPDGGTLRLDVKNIELDEDFCEDRPWARCGSFVLLEVADSGEGMAPEVVSRIFDPFYTTKENAGTGLGLSMVQSVVRQHDALLDVKSRRGEGTAFRIYWPRIDPPAVRTQEETAGEGSRQILEGHETILVAEDDEVVRDMAARILEHGGYTVLVASNGEEAVRMFEEKDGAVDLVLLDVIMPVMGGLAAREEIRKIEPQARFLLSSGYSAATKHRDPGGIEIPLVSKPFDYDQLLARVREILDAPLED